MEGGEGRKKETDPGGRGSKIWEPESGTRRQTKVPSPSLPRDLIPSRGDWKKRTSQWLSPLQHFFFFGQLALLKPESHCQEVSQGRFARESPWNLLDFFLLPSHKRGCRKLRGIKGPEYGHPRETDQGYGSEHHGSEVFMGR